LGFRERIICLFLPNILPLSTPHTAYTLYILNTMPFPVFMHCVVYLPALCSYRFIVWLSLLDTEGFCMPVPIHASLPVYTYILILLCSNSGFIYLLCTRWGALGWLDMWSCMLPALVPFLLLWLYLLSCSCFLLILNTALHALCMLYYLLCSFRFYGLHLAWHATCLYSYTLPSASCWRRR
jgi:hypothetical protein